MKKTTSLNMSQLKNKNVLKLKGKRQMKTIYPRLRSIHEAAEEDKCSTMEEYDSTDKNNLLEIDAFADTDRCLTAVHLMKPYE